MDIKPILATLSRHKLIATLLALLVALTCAIVCNVAFMIRQQVALISLPSGVAEDQVVMLDSTSLDRKADQVVAHQADLAALRMIPGVQSAAAVNALPFNGDNWISSVQTSPDAQSQQLASVFYGTPGELETLGVHLVAGRDFLPEEYVAADGGDAGLQHAPAAIISRALADRLFPGQGALGKSIYPYPNPIRVVGVVDRLLRPSVGAGHDNYDVMIFPMQPSEASVTYVLRTAPQQRARVLQAAQQALYRVNPDRVVRNAMTFSRLRARYFQRERSMIGLLVASALGMLLVAALGITGLANFWVQQRIRSIGIRRALGARRRDILCYFQTENFLIVTLGVVLGVILAVGVNLLLMARYQQPRLPLWYLPVGAVALWMLGQLAVLAPALRAANVPPVVATRSV